MRAFPPGRLSTDLRRGSRALQSAGLCVQNCVHLEEPCARTSEQHVGNGLVVCQERIGKAGLDLECQVSIL